MTKELGKYRLEETPLGNKTCVDVFINGEYFVTFTDCNVNCFNSVEELEIQLEDVEPYEDFIDPFGNYGEMMAAKHDLAVERMMY